MHKALLVEGDGFEPSKSVTTDLQSAPFGHSGTPPYICAAYAALFNFWSWRTESNPRPADYKSAALPAELHQRIIILNGDPERARTVDLQRDRLAF